MNPEAGPSLTEVLGKSGDYRRMRRQKRGLPPLDMAASGSARLRIKSSMQRPVMGMQKGDQQRLLHAALRAKEAQMRRTGLGGTRRSGPRPSWDDSIQVPQVRRETKEMLNGGQCQQTRLDIFSHPVFAHR
jgi:hypothetical protein